MPPTIPDFDHNLVLPPHKGDPRRPADLSPYPCTTVDLCLRFATSEERREILRGFLDFRGRLSELGLTRGFQWLDGSFLENVEEREGRSPRDLDLITVYWGYSTEFQESMAERFPEILDHQALRAAYHLDHYLLDAELSPEFTADTTCYWAGLFSHNRHGVWKGMLKIDLGTPENDAEARQILAAAPR